MLRQIISTYSTKQAPLVSIIYSLMNVKEILTTHFKTFYSSFINKCMIFFKDGLLKMTFRGFCVMKY